MQTVDVIIAGTGLYGTCLGAILARHGVRVQLIERARHPRFALGEALLPQSAIWPFILSNRFGVPELGALSHADRIVDQRQAAAQQAGERGHLCQLYGM